MGHGWVSSIGIDRRSGGVWAPGHGGVKNRPIRSVLDRPRIIQSVPPRDVSLVNHASPVDF